MSEHNDHFVNDGDIFINPAVIESYEDGGSWVRVTLASGGTRLLRLTLPEFQAQLDRLTGLREVQGW